MSRDFLKAEVLPTILPFPSSHPKLIVKWVKCENGTVSNKNFHKDLSEFQEKISIFIVENYWRLEVFP